MSTVWGFQDMQIHTHTHMRACAQACTPGKKSPLPSNPIAQKTQNSCHAQELLKRRAINQMERSVCIPSQSLCFSPAIPLWENLIVPQFPWRPSSLN